MMNLEAQPNALNVGELLNIVRTQARGMWRYRWYSLAIAWSVVLVLSLVVFVMPPIYKASARIYVDTETLLKPLLAGLSLEEKDAVNDVTLVTRAMLARPSIERVARETDLDLTVTTPLEHEQLIKSIEKRIRIAGSRERIFDIEFTDSDRARALEVVRILLDGFLEGSIDKKQSDAEQADQTIRSQIAEYERRLVESENELKEFKRRNVGMMPTDRGDYYQRLQLAIAELDGVKQRLSVAEEKASVLRAQLRGQDPSVNTDPGSVAAAATSPLDDQIKLFEQKLMDLSLEFTDNHPDVIRTKAMLEELRARRQVRAPGEGAAFGGQVDPVIQQIQIQLSAADVDVASLRAELRVKEAAVQELRKMVDVIPQVEADLNRLNRDYGVVKTRYEQMLGRLESLKTTERIRESAENVRFRVIDPPFAASLPIGPNRTIFIIGALLASLVLGCALAFGLNLSRPVFGSVREVAALKLPILGQVGLELDAREASRQRMMKLTFAAMATGLVVVTTVAILTANSASELLRIVIQ
jgi:polysaccharide chain length determinant protein (PEP-CTERM system associated)